MKWPSRHVSLAKTTAGRIQGAASAQPSTAEEDQARRKSDGCRIWGSAMPTRVTLSLASNAILLLPPPSAVVGLSAGVWKPQTPPSNLSWFLLAKSLVLSFSPPGGQTDG